MRCLHAAGVAMALLAALPSPAHAASFLVDEDLRIDLGGLGRLGYLAQTQDGVGEQRPFFQMARLAAGVAHARFGSAFLQVEGASETLRLLDAFVELRADDTLRGRIGVFRLPTTADFLVPAPGILFSNRSLLVTMTQPRLAGAELEATVGSDTARVNARVGWFQPTTATRELLPDGDGNFVSLRTGVDFGIGLGVHLSYLHLVLADNDPLVVDGAPTARPVPFPQLVDAAVTFRNHGWDATVEGLLAPSEDGGAANLAGYVQAGYRFDLSEDIGLMPAARVGGTYIDESTTLRVTTGLVLFLDENLKVLPNYELQLGDDPTSHTAILTLQATI